VFQTELSDIEMYLFENRDKKATYHISFIQTMKRQNDRIYLRRDLDEIKNASSALLFFPRPIFHFQWECKFLPVLWETFFSLMFESKRAYISIDEK
jgi:hypothetical protein